MLCPPLQAQVWTSNMSKIGDPWGRQTPGAQVSRIRSLRYL